MMGKGTVERAFELARMGSCRTVEDIRCCLSHESHSSVDAHLAGAGIRKQLKELMRTPRGASSGNQLARSAILRAEGETG
jgi:hypothetical protein